MNAEPDADKSPRRQTEVDARVGSALIQVKFGTDALRTVRTSVMQLAYSLARYPECKGFLVLVNSTITEERLRAEWQSAQSIFRPEVIDRVTICSGSEGKYLGIPQDPEPRMQAVLDEVVRDKRSPAASGVIRPDYFYIVFKLLLHQWLTVGEPVTTSWLAQSAGCSYLTVARALRKLGGLLDRKVDRRIGLRYFPREEFSRLLAVSDKVRSTSRFVDRSGQLRSPEVHLRRLEKLEIPRVALGGVLGARHYYRDLDLVGIPRLDLSLHCPKKHADLSFIAQLDPALKREEDPLKTPNVVVHIVRSANSLFEPRDGSLFWADPLECLFDLHEAHLEAQAAQFLDALLRNRRPQP